MKVVAMILGLVLMPAGVVAQSAPQGAIERGKEVYETFCWSCHGRYGRGDGPAAQYLATPPADFTNPAVLGGRSNQQIVTSLIQRKGSPDTAHMPMTTVTETVKEDALRDAIAYIRTLTVPGKHVSVLAGKDIYETFCSVCHGSQGDGRGPAAKNLSVKPRDFTSKDFVIEGREEEIYRIIFMGATRASHGSPLMPEWKTTLSREQVQDIIEYLKTFKRPQP
ncbi:MAG: c-type cytochrome [Candidatus Methylomirabilales bacterium]